MRRMGCLSDDKSIFTVAINLIHTLIMNLDNEEKIRKRKDKKLLKHFSGVINNVKIKIVNYRFKKHKTPFETVDVIELLSKIKFHKLQKEDALIQIENENFILELTGDWKYEWSGPEENCVAYSIKNKIERNKI